MYLASQTTVIYIMGAPWRATHRESYLLGQPEAEYEMSTGDCHTWTAGIAHLCGDN